MNRFLIYIAAVFCCKTFANTEIDNAIRLFNQQDYSSAQVILEKESNKNNAYATFWLGVTQYKNRQQFEAGETFLKAAEMGSPWAMGVLSGGYYANNPCNYLGWSCDEIWAQRAIKEWEKQSNNGNGKATLQLQFFKHRWRDYIPYLGRTLKDKSYVDALKNGGMNAISYINSSSGFSHEEKIEYNQFAARQDYAPAMEYLYYQTAELNFNKASHWLDKAIELGYAKAAESMYFAYRSGKWVSTNPNEAYYYNRLSGALGGEEREAHLITEKNSLDENGFQIADDEGNPIMDILVTQEEQSELNRQVEERIKDIKPNMFLDETSIDLF